MKKRFILLSAFTFLFCLTAYSQQLNLGLKVDVTKIVILRPIQPYNSISSINALPALFLKFGVLFWDKLELELDGGYQLGDRFDGAEAAFLAKYRIWNNIFTFLSYLNHQNDGHEGTGSGTSSYSYNFLGVGAEFKMSDLLGLDIAYYHPVGENGYDYEYISAGLGDYKRVNTSQISSFISFGMIFNF